MQENTARNKGTLKYGRGDACLTCRARARSVVTREDVLTRHEQSAKGARSVTSQIRQNPRRGSGPFENGWWGSLVLSRSLTCGRRVGGGGATG